MVHENSEDILRGLYKSASFVVQAIAFRQTGRYISRLNELVDHVSEKDKAIVETFMALKQGEPIQFPKMSERLFAWQRV